MTTLMEKGADLDMQTLTGNTALMNAVREEEDGSVDFMLSNGSDVNVINDDGNTALILAAQGGRVDLMKKLVDHPQFNSPDCQNLSGWNAIMYAVQENQMEMVTLLVTSAHVNLDLQHPETGNTAIMIAAIEKHNDMLKMLLKAGASPHVRNHKSQSVLVLAQQAGNEEAVKFLATGLSSFIQQPGTASSYIPVEHCFTRWLHKQPN
jgi:ankyrin repeat protein